MQIDVSVAMRPKSKQPAAHHPTPIKAAHSALPVPKERLRRKMSEVLSLREKVAQAEIAARLHGGAAERAARLTQSDKVVGLEANINSRRPIGSLD